MPNTENGKTARHLLIGLGMQVWADGILGTVVEVMSSTEVMIREKGGARYFKAKVAQLLSLDDPRVKRPSLEAATNQDDDLSLVNPEALEVASRRYAAILPLLRERVDRVSIEAEAKASGISLSTLYGTCQRL